MNTRTCRTRLLYSTLAALLPWLLLATDSKAQAPQQPSASTSQSAPVHIGNVLHIVGLDDKPGGTGDLDFSQTAMTFHVRGHSAQIPLRDILAFSVAHDDKALMSGAKGKLAEAAPYGVGFAVTMSRPSAETLTLFYSDSDGAIHACVLVLPKGMGDGVASALGPELSPTDYPKTGSLMRSKPQQEPGTRTAPAFGSSKPSVEVALPSEDTDGIPSAFPAAVYEGVIEQLAQSGRFAQVWRAGDKRANPDALVLHVDIENWKKGSARGRAFGPFTGTTEIESSVTLQDRSGRILFQKNVNGAKRTSGENLEATNSLAKHIRKAMEKSDALRVNKQGGK